MNKTGCVNERKITNNPNPPYRAWSGLSRVVGQITEATPKRVMKQLITLPIPYKRVLAVLSSGLGLVAGEDESYDRPSRFIY